MERRNELIITIVLLIIFMVFIFNMMGNISLATGENTSTNSIGGSTSTDENTSTNTIGGGGTLPQASYLAPYPVFNNYTVSNQNSIIKIPENTTVRQLLNDISIKLLEDEKGIEWKLTELPQTYIDKNGEEKKVVDFKIGGYGKATYGVVVDLNKEEHGIVKRGRVWFWITNLKGEKLEIDDVIGTGTTIEWSNGDFGRRI